MSIIQKLLGKSGYFMEADEATLTSLKSTEPKPEKAKKEKAKPAPEPKVESAPVVQPVPEEVIQATTESVAAPAPVTSVAVTDSGTMTEPASANAAPKKSRKKSKAVVAAAAPAQDAAVGDVQALVAAAIAQDSAERVKEAEAGSSDATFATDYLVVPTMKGRRRPGPSLAGFMGMAGSMRR